MEIVICMYAVFVKFMEKPVEDIEISLIVSWRGPIKWVAFNNKNKKKKKKALKIFILNFAKKKKNAIFFT